MTSPCNSAIPPFPLLLVMMVNLFLFLYFSLKTPTEEGVCPCPPPESITLKITTCPPWRHRRAQGPMTKLEGNHWNPELCCLKCKHVLYKKNTRLKPQLVCSSSTVTISGELSHSFYIHTQTHVGCAKPHLISILHTHKRQHPQLFSFNVQ